MKQLLREKGVRIYGECPSFSVEEALQAFKEESKEISPVESLFKGTVLDLDTPDLRRESMTLLSKRVLQFIDYLNYFVERLEVPPAVREVSIHEQTPI